MANRKMNDEYYKGAMEFFRAKRGKEKQSTVAEALDLSTESYNRLENGKTQLTDANLNILLEHFKVERSELEKYLVANNCSIDRSELPPKATVIIEPIVTGTTVVTEPTIHATSSQQKRAPVSGKPPILSNPLRLVALVAGTVILLVLIKFVFLRDTSGLTQTGPSALENQLAQVNVFPAGKDAPKAQILLMQTSLQTDPSLRVFAETILHVLGERRFSEPIHLDTVFGYYKRLIKFQGVKTSDWTPDSWHPAENECMDVEKIKQAIIHHWKDSHPGSAVKSFDDLFGSNSK